MDTQAERFLAVGYGTYPAGKFTVSIRQDPRGRWQWTRRETQNPAAGTWISRESWTNRVQAESVACNVACCYDAVVELPGN